MTAQTVHKPRNASGVLYYDPNPTAAKLATAGLRLAGYEVLYAQHSQEVIELCKLHGPAGDNSIGILLLDASANPANSSEILKSLLKLPKTASLPGILLVNRKLPTPILGAEHLPSLRRPFSTPALIKVVRENLGGGSETKGIAQIAENLGASHLREALEKSFPAYTFSEEAVRQFEQKLEQDANLPKPPVGVAFSGDLSAVRLDATLEMLAQSGARGILQVKSAHWWGRLYVETGNIRFAEFSDESLEDLKLGRFVIEGGFLREEELEAFIVGQDPQGRPLGDRLVESGLLRPTELLQVILEQAKAITYQLLTWTQGTFEFIPKTQLEPIIRALSPLSQTERRELRIREALILGLRRLDESALMGSHMPDIEDVYLRVNDEVAKLQREDLSRDELRILELINGRNSIKEIARKNRMGSFAVARTIYQLTKAHLVRKSSPPVVA